MLAPINSWRKQHDGVNMETKKCNTCEEYKFLTQFNTNGWFNSGTSKKRKYHAHCKPCMAKQVHETHIARIEQAVGGKLICHHCGWEGPHCGYDFHHLDPSKKEVGIGALYACSFERIKNEIEKCVVLCCLCHRLHHGGHIQLDVTAE